MLNEITPRINWWETPECKNLKRWCDSEMYRTLQYKKGKCNMDSYVIVQYKWNTRNKWSVSDCETYHDFFRWIKEEFYQCCYKLEEVYDLSLHGVNKSFSYPTVGFGFKVKDMFGNLECEFKVFGKFERANKC